MQLRFHSVRSAIAPFTGALLLGAIGVASVGACSAPDDAKYGAPNAIVGRKAPDSLNGTTGGGTTGGGTTGGASGECVDGSPAIVSDLNCAVKWTTDIFPKIQDNGAWKCATAGCHAVTDPKFSATDAKTTYTQLRAHKSKNFGVYINPCSKDPAASYILANFQGTKGQQMPIPPAKPADITQLETWVKCGAPSN